MKEKRLTTTEAAAYLGVTRQAIAHAAKRGEIGTKVDALGTRDGWIYLFTTSELDAWKARERHAGGRPPGSKIGVATPSPVIAAR